jgi:hypothetical protein
LPDAPLGFSLPGFVGGGLFLDSAGNPPARFVDPDRRPIRTDRRLGVSIGHRSTFSSRNDKRCGRQGDPLRVFAPVRSRTFIRDGFRDIGFTSRRVGIAADRPAVFGSPLGLPGSLGIASGAERTRARENANNALEFNTASVLREPTSRDARSIACSATRLCAAPCAWRELQIEPNKGDTAPVTACIFGRLGTQLSLVRDQPPPETAPLRF